MESRRGEELIGRFQFVKLNSDKVVAGLGELWHTELIRIKLHACVGGCHGQIEVIEKLQKQHPDRFTLDKLRHIRKINTYFSHPVYAHDGWVPEERPLTETGGQMNAAVRPFPLPSWRAKR